MSSPAPLPQREVLGKGDARRRAIARAGAHVLRTTGIEGLTHRAVALEADIPLGSTTYYYATRDDLVEAAVTYATERSIAWLTAWGRDQANSDITAALPDMLYRYLTDYRATAAFEVELYVLAARRPELRVHTSRWTDAFVDILAGFVPRDVAAHAAATFNGLLLINISSERAVSRTGLSTVLAAALSGGPAATAIEEPSAAP
jgi:DNA-binding transcriptional regulator YbjK